MPDWFNIFDKFVHADWFNTFLGVVIICVITFLICRVTVAFMRRILKKTTLLPSSSIFINLVRAVVWIFGIACILSICFNVNINAMIAGLGVVGIAVSLGFQDTLSNLLGGLQVSVSRSVEPGDNIRMGPSGVSGVVQDVTWRYTSIIDSSGNHINIPNSLMTSTAVAKLSPLNDVSINLVVTTNSERLTATAHHIEDAAEKAVSRVSKIKKGPSVSFSAITDKGFQGTLSFTITDASKASNATDAAIRAVAPYVHNHLIEEAMSSLTADGEDHGTAPVLVPTDETGVLVPVPQTSTPQASASATSSGPGSEHSGSKGDTEKSEGASAPVSTQQEKPAQA